MTAQGNQKVGSWTPWEASALENPEGRGQVMEGLLGLQIAWNYGEPSPSAVACPIPVSTGPSHLTLVTAAVALARLEGERDGEKLQTPQGTREEGRRKKECVQGPGLLLWALRTELGTGGRGTG